MKAMTKGSTPPRRRAPTDEESAQEYLDGLRDRSVAKARRAHPERTKAMLEAARGPKPQRIRNALAVVESRDWRTAVRGTGTSPGGARRSRATELQRILYRLTTATGAGAFRRLLLKQAAMERLAANLRGGLTDISRPVHSSRRFLAFLIVRANVVAFFTELQRDTNESDEKFINRVQATVKNHTRRIVPA